MQVGSTAHFLSLQNGKTMDIRGASEKEGAEVICFQKHGGENQLFFVDTQIGWIVNVFSRKAITYDVAQAKLVQQNYCSSIYQQWIFEQYQAGFIIRSANDGEHVITYDQKEKTLILRPFMSEEGQVWYLN